MSIKLLIRHEWYSKVVFFENTTKREEHPFDRCPFRESIISFLIYCQCCWGVGSRDKGIGVERRRLIFPLFQECLKITRGDRKSSSHGRVGHPAGFSPQLKQKKMPRQEPQNIV